MRLKTPADGSARDDDRIARIDAIETDDVRSRQCGDAYAFIAATSEFDEKCVGLSREGAGIQGAASQFVEL